MTQHKAAALTSSLFARKGRASPASLLIADLEEMGPHQPARGRASKADPLEAANGDKVQGDNNGRVGSNGGAIPVAGLNAAVRRHKTKPPPAELPLLAFVEAQEAGESKKAAGGAVGTVAETDSAEPQSARRAAAVPHDDLQPAASLLERGSQAMRRAKAHAAVRAVESPEHPKSETDKPARIEPAKVDGGLTAKAGADDEAVMAPETVSGDSNIAAIEDAPPDDTAGSVAAEPAFTAPASAEPVAEVEVAGADLAVDDQAGASAAAAPEAAAGVAAAAEAAEGPGAAMSATVALRKAAALAPDRPLPLATALVEPAPRPVPAEARPWAAAWAAKWRPAAVVTLGVALGLAAYVAISGKPVPRGAISEQSAPQAAVPASSAPQAVIANNPAPQAAPVIEPTLSPAPAAEPSAPETAAGQPEAPLPEPSFDVIRIEPNGQSIIAGRALPFSEWILLNNGRPIASIRADAYGEWVVLPDAALVPGANAFSLVPKTEHGKVAIPALSQEPAAAAPSGTEQAPPGPSSEGLPLDGATSTTIALPKFKPASLPQAAAVAVSPGGAYEVQVASVRQNADAARELARLATAFPAQLGQLDLRVQKASVEGAGTFYRVRSGAIEDLGAAREVCRQLDAVGQGCLVVRRAPFSDPAQTEVVVEPESLGSAGHQQAERPQ